MAQLNLFYRAFKDYRKAIEDERESKLLRKEIVNKDSDDKVSFTQSICTIEEDWIKAIEDGLIFIGKCIDEDRQFIRSEGTVDPIEKVRHVSRETSEHLAKHSNLITHITYNEKGEQELMPEKLYTVERLNNYAVYENRFLYLVLTTLDSFVSERYNRIVRETNAYHGVAHLHKTVTAGKRKIEYTFDLDESSDDDPFIRSRSSLGALLERLERIQRSLFYYLHTPLITEVAKADKLKPPVTKTNVLRMDKNFKEVVTLYEYIAAYTGDGFTITRQEHIVDFKKNDVAEQFSEPVLLLSFLAYEHGMDLGDMLKQQYAEEEIERRAAEEREFKEKLASTRARLKEKKISPEEYIILLEKRIADMEKGERELITAKERIDELETQNGELQSQIDARVQEIAALNEQHSEELRRRDEQYDELKLTLDAQATAHAEELAELRRLDEEEIARLNEEHNAKTREADELLRQSGQQNADLKQQLNSTGEKYAVAIARLTALRKEHGLITDSEDFTSEAAFTELEHELEVFNNFVRGEWKEAKLLLRKDVFGKWKQSLKVKKDKKDKNVNDAASDAAASAEVPAENKPAEEDNSAETAGLVTAAQAPAETPSEAAVEETISQGESVDKPVEESDGEPDEAIGEALAEAAVSDASEAPEWEAADEDSEDFVIAQTAADGAEKKEEYESPAVTEGAEDKDE